MARHPKYQRATLSIFNNTPPTNGVVESFEDIMDTPNRVVAKFSMPKNKEDVSIGNYGIHVGYCRVWMRFEQAITIPMSLNLVIKASARTIQNSLKYDIPKEYNKKLRRSHTVWVAKTMRVSEFSSSYHSCMIDSITRKPIGFVSIAKRNDQIVSYITQNYNGRAKHIIFTPSFEEVKAVNGGFTHNSYRDMMKIIKDIENESEDKIEIN